MNNASLYINTVGKLRQDTVYPDQPAVTIASVDIGGGTTDLMIANYQANPGANISVLTPSPMFWEGFNLAGDDILKRVIERIVLPTIKLHAEKCGCRNSVNVMNFLFGPYLGRTTAKDKLMKKQFAMQIAIPIGTDILQHASEERPTEKRSFDSFFVNYPHPNQQLIDYINKEFENEGCTGFDIEKITWELDNEGTNKVVKDVVEKMIGDLCGIIAQYECDYVLLSGRPSQLPVVRDLFLKKLPVTPDRTVRTLPHRHLVSVCRGHRRYQRPENLRCSWSHHRTYGRQPSPLRRFHNRYFALETQFLLNSRLPWRVRPQQGTPQRDIPRPRHRYKEYQILWSHDARNEADAHRRLDFGTDVQVGLLVVGGSTSVERPRAAHIRHRTRSPRQRASKTA